ncbi:MOZ/SAS family domain-containing protein [Hirsutella rhossiliensis]|uniref:Histone acetyltransferase n=1 Tax=Hirsutella rhossiliensis TaxID=111463 RepID=A0A9P8SI29_9HYPO|nr:MOZ/SAS family domain-containing protein [Hirsutella rhossiliensis]KAH0961596.1 MOZ/SAS family domain-containing protein [Hirsutella rhossiliensis]
MEEELQQSVLLSEDAEYETADSFADNATDSTPREDMGSDDDDELSDRDASGEEIDEDASDEDGEQDEDAEGDDDDLEEGVGAVKIKPGEAEDDEDAESEVSELPSVPDEESDEDGAAWEDGDVADDDESDAAPPNACTFCKQDEENDPSEDFEAFLTCTTCGENAHQQCARDAVALTEKNHSKDWRCPECYTGNSDVDDDEIEIKDGASVGNNSLSMSQRSDEPNLAREPSNSDEQSVSQRKTSSAEPDETGGSLRKRRRNRSSESTAHGDGGGDQSGESNRASRMLRLRAQRPPPVTVERRSRTSLVLKFVVRPGNLKEILSRRKRDNKRRPGALSRPAPPPRTTPALTATPFYSFFDKETDDAKGKPYGGILSEAEADTSKTLPTPDDRKRFDQAKQKAEDEWRARVLAMQAEADVPLRKPKKANENASQIECIEFGGWEIDTWYAAPYPAEYSRNRVLYICEFCLKYMNSDYVAWRHKLKCATKHPPGDEIYRHESVSIFEVDGRKHPVYCQNLCLLAKLFLGSKTLYYDVEPFLFYILCEYDERGYHFVGYFSKEKRASSQNNVSCILTLPIHQRKGYGNLLIDFSYLLTKTEQKTGSPEKPLSDMGLVSYRNYWRLELCRYFLNLMEGDEHKKDGLSVKQISDETGMTADDVVSALEGLRALVRDPQTQQYAFRVDSEYCRQYVAKWESKGYVRLKAEALAWTPYVMGRSNAVNFELGPPISTIAPREDDETKAHEDPDSADASVTSETNMPNGSEPVKSIEKVAPEDKENAEPQTDVRNAVPDCDSWAAPYRDIPPTRFEVFPPVTGGRRADPSRPRSSASRRKTGGTGRGPGRWPKGTKKSDYGNADSGPGLPPGWKEKQARMRAEAGGATPEEEEALTDKPAQDEVQVVVGKASANGKATLDSGLASGAWAAGHGAPGASGEGGMEVDAGG